MKKVLALVLMAVLLISAVPAVAEDEPIIITALMSGDNNPSPENPILDEIQRRTGVKLVVDYVSGEGRTQRLNTLIAGDDLPDIFQVAGQTALDLRDAGKIVDLAPYLEEYGKDILAEVGEDLKKMPINAGVDGIYGIRSNVAGKIDNLIIRKDWLANVGKEMPTNLDELYEVLKAFTFDDPDKNGQNDTYGLTCSIANSQNWEHVFGAYGIAYNQAYLMEDGTVTTYMKAPKYLDAVKYFRRLLQEGIMDPDFATLTNMQTFEKLWQGKVGVYAWEAVGPTNNWYPARYTFEVPANPEDIFAAIHLTEGTGGIKKYSGYNDAFVISAKCEHPEAAMKLYNDIWCTEEGNDLVYLGVEGVMYEWIDKENGKYQRLGDYTDDATHRAAGAYCYWQGGFKRNNTEIRLLNACTQKMQADEREIATDYPFIIRLLNTRTEYGTTLDGITKEAFANLLVCEDAELEDLYAEYVQRWEEEGGLEYEEEATAAYKEENP